MRVAVQNLSEPAATSFQGYNALLSGTYSLFSALFLNHIRLTLGNSVLPVQEVEGVIDDQHAHLHLGKEVPRYHHRPYLDHGLEKYI